MNEFQIHPLSRFRERNPPVYQQPFEVATFSTDKNRNLHLDSRALKFFHPSGSISCSLSTGFSSAIFRDQSIPEHVDSLLHVLLDLQNSKKATQVSREVDVITWRGILTTIICTPFNRKEGWELAVSKFKGKLFIEQRDTPASIAKREAEKNETQQLMGFWGYKFEQLTTWNSRTPPTPEQREAWNAEPVNNNEAFCSVIYTKFGTHRMVFGAEVDCADPKAPVASKGYIELKTSKMPDDERTQRSLIKFKMLKFWAQSFLGNIPRIVIGFRDDEGKILSLKTYDTMRIPSEAVKDNHWDPNLCLTFGERFLSWVKASVVEENPNISYIITYDEVTETIRVRLDRTYSFLPAWFVEVFDPTGGAGREEVGPAFKKTKMEETTPTGESREPAAPSQKEKEKEQEQEEFIV